MAAKLTVVAGPHAGQVFVLADRDTFLVGRSPECHFRPAHDDPYLSDRHFLVEFSTPRCRVVDLNSRTGIRVNGRKVSVADLAGGDEVRAGQTVVQLSIEPPGSKPSPGKEVRPAKPIDGSGSPPAVPGYEIEKEIGRGSRGVVYRATRQADGEHVAINVLRPAPGVPASAVERFLEEVRPLKDVQEGNVVGLLDCGATGPAAYLVTECLVGPNVEQVVRERGPLPIRTAVLAVAHALTGLSRLHARGAVHGDIRPSKLVVGRAGEKKVVKLTDLGVARAYDEAGLGGSSLWGEPGRPLGFAAPEQVTHVRRPTPAADQYAAAATLYFLLTRSHPHDLPEEPDRALATVLTAEAVPVRTRRADVPELLEALLTRALSRDPAARFPDVATFRSQLAEFARHFEAVPVGESVPG